MATLQSGPSARSGSADDGRRGGSRGPGGAPSWRQTLARPATPYYVLLGASALLLTLGLIMVLSSSSVYAYEYHGQDSYAIVKRQLMWVLVGLPCAWVASRMPLRHVRAVAWPAMGLALVLLALTLTPLGRTVNGNTNWLGLGPFQVQPSEIAKLAVVLWSAHVYALKRRRLPALHPLVMPVGLGFALVIGLVVWQRDLGTALVIVAIGLGMLWVVGAPGRLFTLALTSVGVIAFFLASTSPERRERLTTFTDPFRDYHDTGWQPAHGLYALSSGGWFGEGLGASQQKWGNLPEAHTDFIFAVLGEELGLVGTMLVIGLFLAIAWAGTRVAMQTVDPFVRYTSFGLVVWLLSQMMINVGMVLTLLPVIGIPLPLVSYGGSALLPSLVALGLLVGFARRNRREAGDRAAPGSGAYAGAVPGTPGAAPGGGQ